MSLLKLKFLDLMPNPSSLLVNADIATNERLITWLGKLQAQINHRPDVYAQSTSPLIDPQIVCMTLQTSAAGTLSVTWSTAFKAGTTPFVVLTALSTLTTQPTVAELSQTPTNTGCVVKTYRTKTQGVLLGGTIDPVQAQQAFFTVLAIGQAP